MTSTSAITNALDKLCAGIRKNHPDVPYVLITVGSASVSGRVKRLCHFDRGSWKDQPTLFPELYVSWDLLTLGPEESLKEILKELTHALAAARNVSDTSKEGIYHNAQYMALATELGLYWPADVPPDPRVGFEDMQLSLPALTLYRRELHVLKDVTAGLSVAIRPSPPPSTRNNLKAECLCSTRRIIRASKRVLDGPDIICSACNSPFREAY